MKSVCRGVHSERKEGGVERERAVEMQYKKSTERWEAQRKRERGSTK